MPVYQPTVGEKLSVIITRAEEMHNFALATIPQELLLDTDEKTVFVALLSLAIEHHGAILHLLRTGMFNGSASALARPLIESIYRALWLHSHGTPKDFASVRAGAAPYPKFSEMADTIERATPTADTAFTAIKPFIGSLHGFTHGGLEQLGRRFDGEGNVRATFTDGELQELANATTAYLVMMAVAWCQIYAGGDPTTEPRSAAIMDTYNQKYGPPTAV